jgi:hypothetical protein
MSARRDPLSGTVLTWIALGGTVLALAFAVRPVHASPVVFWVVAVAGLLALLAGCVSLGRGMWARRRRLAVVSARRRRLAGRECRRLYEALSLFVAEREQVRPRNARWSPSTARLEEWRVETTALYRDEIRGWAMRVVEDAVACDVLSASSRALVHAPAPSQLAAVRDLFRDAAQDLEAA